jgi:hypothetical protein
MDSPSDAQRANMTWLMENIPDDKEEFMKRLVEFRAFPLYGAYKSKIGIIEGVLKFATFDVSMSVMSRQPFSKSFPVYRLVEKWANDRKLLIPKELGRKNIVYNAGRTFVWQFTEKGLLDGMFQGFYICFPVAFLVLLIASRNIILATLAVFTIAGIVATVLGLCKSVNDWDLGKSP